MNKFSGKIEPIRKLSEEQIQKWSGELLSILKTTIQQESTQVANYVDHLQELNEGIDRQQLAKKIISRRSLKSGGIGAICGLGGALTMLVSMPSDLYLTFRIQARMVLAIAYLYGWDINDEEMQTDALLVMGGNLGSTALKKVGIQIGQEYTKKAVQKHITKEVMKKINKVISRKIITKAGEKSLVSFAKLVPVIGAPIGGTIDYISTQMVGRTALKFYKG